MTLARPLGPSLILNSLAGNSFSTFSGGTSFKVRGYSSLASPRTTATRYIFGQAVGKFLTKNWSKIPIIDNFCSWETLAWSQRTKISVERFAMLIFDFFAFLNFAGIFVFFFIFAVGFFLIICLTIC